MTNQNKIAFELLYKQFYPMVQQMTIGFVKGDHHQAKDLAQDVFINIWNSYEKFRGEASHKTWIYRVTVNTCLKFIRDKKETYKIPICDETLKLEDTAKPAADKEYGSLYNAIGSLNEVDRLIIMMVLDELDYDEISNIMGISAVNLRVKIHRIKKNLKNLLENEN